MGTDRPPPPPPPHGISSRVFDKILGTGNAMPGCPTNIIMHACKLATSKALANEIITSIFSINPFDKGYHFSSIRHLWK